MNKNERHFVLVHGARHGAWCWYKVATLLKSAGHKVTALDMAASGVNPKQAEDVTCFSHYIEPLMEFMTALPSDERVILVGHSAGGGCISVAMENFPHKVSVAVFATALMPGPNLSFAALCQEFRRRLGATSERSENLPTLDRSASSGNQLSPPEDVTLAKSLMRPYPRFIDEELFEAETRFSQEKFGRVARIYMMTDQDQIIKEDFQRWMIEKHPTNEVKHVNGSDHMLMFSIPLQLFSCLHDIACNYP
ncbi:hypothetical protein L6164_019953 [Bauhinia variegata]|uniref:Uncharacterized protein n=1 Tax=Bauhinia variegata TaxID=167791 RepID=A0ACB9MTW5_BAUVA|nr:hypothetical protein L6164_019953 [Bauhinia variegata]